MDERSGILLARGMKSILVSLGGAQGVDPSGG